MCMIVRKMIDFPVLCFTLQCHAAKSDNNLINISNICIVHFTNQSKYCIYTPIWNFANIFAVKVQIILSQVSSGQNVNNAENSTFTFPPSPCPYASVPSSQQALLILTGGYSAYHKEGEVVCLVVKEFY